jgi:hypothetical protein
MCPLSGDRDGERKNLAPPSGSIALSSSRFILPKATQKMIGNDGLAIIVAIEKRFFWVLCREGFTTKNLAQQPK